MFEDASLCVIGNINRDIKTAPLQAGDHLLRDGESSTRFIVATICGGGANTAFAAAAPSAARASRGCGAHLARDAGKPSGPSLALSYDNGHRHFVSCLPANEALGSGDLD